MNKSIKSNKVLNRKMKVLTLCMSIIIGLISNTPMVHAINNDNLIDTQEFKVSSINIGSTGKAIKPKVDAKLKKVHEKLKKYAGKYVTDYVELETQLDVDSKKILTITFNKPISKESLKLDSRNGYTTKNSPIKLVESDIGVSIDFKPQIDGNTVKIPCLQRGYTEGESYILVVTKDIESQDKNLGNILKLKQEVVMCFTIKESLTTKIGNMGGGLDVLGKNAEEKNGKFYFNGKLPTEEWIPNINSKIYNLCSTIGKSKLTMEYVYQPSTNNGKDTTTTTVTLFDNPNGEYIMTYIFNLKKNHELLGNAEPSSSKIVICMQKSVEKYKQDQIKASIKSGIPCLLDEKTNEISSYIIKNYESFSKGSQQFGKYKVTCVGKYKLSERLGGGYCNGQVINITW